MESCYDTLLTDTFRVKGKSFFYQADTITSEDKKAFLMLREPQSWAVW